MKRLFLLTVLVLFTGITSSAQPYQSIFGKDSTTWTIQNTYNFQTSTQFKDYHLIVEKDTMYQGRFYKKIIKTNLLYDSAFVAGLIREDTLTGKVWYNQYPIVNTHCSFAADTNERLIFDFSLQVGDSFNLFYPYNIPYNVPAVVDSVYYLNGKKHICFYGVHIPPPPTFERIEFIEGIGGTTGPIYKHSCDRIGQHYLKCMKKDGIGVFESKGYPNFCSGMNGIPTLQAVIPQVYPNPVSIGTGFTIEYPKPLQKVNAISMDGRKTSCEISDKGEGIYWINSNHLGSGVWALEVFTKNQKIFHYKIVIQ